MKHKGKQEVFDQHARTRELEDCNDLKNNHFKLIRVYTIHGEAFINPVEISGILPKSMKDISPYILMKTGDKFYISELDLLDLIMILKPYLAL